MYYIYLSISEGEREEGGADVRRSAAVGETPHPLPGSGSPPSPPPRFPPR